MKVSQKVNDRNPKTIRYTAGKSSFGIILVTFTEHGICGVSMVSSFDSIPEYLKKEYPGAEIRKGAVDDQYVRKIIDILDGVKADLITDIHGTEFQEAVWRSIRSIPYGSTATYSQIAEQIGRPSATRAVANACGKNPIPLIIPCHRVIRKNGGLGGYGLGIERKKNLIEHEKAIKEKLGEKQIVH